MKNNFKLLFVEDDIRYLENFKQATLDFATITHAISSPDAYKLVEDHIYDAIIVDLNISEIQDGKILAELLIQRNMAPVIFLTSDSSIDSKLSCLRLGISDYLWKTMDLDEIKFRIKNAIGNYKKDENTLIIELQNLKLMLNRSIVLLDNQRIDVSALELRLLTYLINQYPQNIQRELFIETVWFTSNVTEGAVSTALYQINKKLRNWNYRIMSIKGKEIGLVQK